jgi:signal peptidase II
MTAGRKILGMPLLGVAVAVVALVADQLSKYVIVEQVMRPEGVIGTPYLTSKIIPLIPFFQLRMSWNEGISFSMFNSGESHTVAILLVVQIAVSLVLIWWLRSLESRWLQVACGLVIGGALGNVIDRAMFGAVADFLDFYVGDWHFPTFNMADSCISIGAGMWLLDAVLARPHDAAQIKDPAP